MITIVSGVLAIALIALALAILMWADRAFEHGKGHELDARSNPDRIAAVATDLIGAAKGYRTGYSRAVLAVYVLMAADLVLVVAHWLAPR